MAIARGAGTEIIQSAHFEYIAGTTTAQKLIIGAEDHIYTVLSIVVLSNTATTNLKCYLVGYDAVLGETAQYTHYFRTGAMSADTTYVWNDKFSFNGFEPADFASGGLTVVADQDKLADQGSSVAQYLEMQKGANGDEFHVHVTYIDQNNA